MESEPLITRGEKEKDNLVAYLRKFYPKVPLPTLIVFFVFIGTVSCTLFALVGIIPNYISPSDSTTIKKLSSNADYEENSNSFGKVFEGTVISIPLGKLSPVLSNSRDGREFYSFYKIPYAKPPIGERRFKLPEPAEPWDGIRREMQFAPQCLQKEKYAPIVISTGEESCLFLNLYAPKIIIDAMNTSEALYPVLVYIHGGGFVNGNGSRYGAEYFMDEDVVLITFDYRLGPFGFLNSMDGTIPGNLGMKDQVMVLKWVKDNIKFFAGDPNRVMIFGNSAGAYSVSAHMISQMSTGLFHRAITQSGTMVCPGALDLKPEVTLEALAEIVGCSNKTIQERVACLRNADGKVLAVIQSPDIIYFPSMEKVNNEEKENIYISDFPSSIYSRGEVSKVPWIVGINSAEFQSFDYLRNHTLIEDLNENWVVAAPELFQYSSDATNMSIAIKDFYFGSKEIGNETIKEFTNLISDRRMDHCSKIAAEYQSVYSDVYMYYLTKEPPKSYMDKGKEGFPPDSYGVGHADELQYLFPYSDYPVIPPDSKYYQFSKTLVKIWTHFASTGNPNTCNSSDWKMINPGENYIKWYQLDDHMEMVETILPRMKLWDGFPIADLNYM